MFDLTVWAVGSLLKGTVLLLAVFAVAGALRTTSAAFRHLVWSAGILAVLVLPLVSLAVPWRLPVIEIPQSPQRVVEPARDPVAPPPVTRLSDQPPVQTREPATSARAVSRLSNVNLAAWALGLWLAGVGLVLGRLAFGALVVRRIVRRGTPLDSPDWTRPLMEAADRFALDRLPRLLLSDRLPMPFACGIVQPAIVLPAEAREWSDRRRRAVLCHELAHVRRLDLPVNALAQLACAVYWFHPLVWVAAHRLRLASERACDDLVLGVGTRPSEYADHLLQIVCRAMRARTPAVALPMAERREFEGRMLAILERDARRDPPTRRHTASLAALALALVVPLAALAPVRTQPPNVANALGLAKAPAQDLPPAASAKPVAARPAPVPERLAREAPVPEQQAFEGQGADTTNAKVVAALVAALQDSVPSVREDAAYALGQLEAKAAVSPLAARLARDPAARVRHMIAWALGQIESRDATQALASAARSDASEDVRGMAIWAMGQIEDPAAEPGLVAALADASVEIRGRAAWALGTLEPDKAPEPLIAALRDVAPAVRLRAAWALGQIEDAAAVPSLTVALKDSSSEVRRAAFWALGQIGGDAAQPALLEALKDPDPEIRARAARALAGSHGDPWPWPWPMPIVR